MMEHAQQSPTIAGSEGPLCVGREVELPRLRELAERTAAEGSGHVALVCGPPGIGKTRLLEELTRRLRAGGLAVLEGRCSEADGAYQPFFELAHAALAFLADQGAVSDRLARAAELIAALRGKGNGFRG